MWTPCSAFQANRILKNIRLNIGPAIRPFVSPSFIGICNPFLNRLQVLGLFVYNAASYDFEIYVYEINLTNFTINES